MAAAPAAYALLTVASAVYSGAQQKKAAGIQAEGVKEQAHMEKLKSQEESNLRRERLLNALAAQSARGGAGGTKGGTAEALKLQSVSDFNKEQGAADVYGASTQSVYSRKASGLRAQGQQAMNKSLLSAATSLASTG